MITSRLIRGYATIAADSTMRAVDLYYHVHKNPKILDSLMKTYDVLFQKGFTSPGIGFPQQVRIINDFEVKRCFDDFKARLQEENIQLDLDKLQEFFQFFALDKDIDYEIR